MPEGSGKRAALLCSQPQPQATAQGPLLPAGRIAALHCRQPLPKAWIQPRVPQPVHPGPPLSTAGPSTACQAACRSHSTPPQVGSRRRLQPGGRGRSSPLTPPPNCPCHSLYNCSGSAPPQLYHTRHPAALHCSRASATSRPQPLWAAPCFEGSMPPPQARQPGCPPPQHASRQRPSSRSSSENPNSPPPPPPPAPHLAPQPAGRPRCYCSRPKRSVRSCGGCWTAWWQPRTAG